MGNFSIILALAAILAGGVVAVNLQSTSSATQGAVAEQQFEILAREVSLAGLQTAVRDIARDAIAMGGFGNAAQFARADVPHDGGAYSVQVRNDCSVLTPGAVTATWPVTPGNFIEVVST